MRTRPNAAYRGFSETSKANDLYRRFKKAFDALVAVENPAIARHEFRDWFVRTPQVEEALIDSTTGEIDSMRFLLGNTGIGKSTMLRYVFGADNAPKIERDSLLIAFCFNSRVPVNDAFNPVVAAASRYLRKQFGIALSSDEFYEFISVTRPDLLEQDADLPESANREDRLSAFRRLHRLGYELEKLKLLLTKTSLKQVILIVDDIESLPFDPQAEFIADVCKAYAFLQNQPTRRFSVRCIISCRKSTHSLLQKEPWYSAYPFDEPIYINSVVDLEKLFEARFHAALKNTQAGQNVANRADWDRAYEIVLKIVNKLSEKYEIVLTNLCNHNVRGALYELQQLLTNRRWFQRDKVVNPSFTIQETDYALNQAAVYRALALRNGDIYPARDSIIANLLHNTTDEASDLLVTYVFRYLLNQKSVGEESSRSQIPKSVLCHDLLALFPDSSGQAEIDACLKYMLDSRLLESEIVRGEEILALTPKAETQWRMLQSNSICLEFFRDDTFQDGDDLGPITPTEHHHPDQAFLGVIGFLDVIVDAEKRRVQTSIEHNLLRAYISRFGERTLSRFLIQGIRRSVARFYIKMSPPHVVNDALEASNDRIAELENLLKNDL